MIKSVGVCLLVCVSCVKEEPSMTQSHEFQSIRDTCPTTFDIVGHYFSKVSPPYTSSFSYTTTYLFSMKNSQSDNKFSQFQSF